MMYKIMYGALFQEFRTFLFYLKIFKKTIDKTVISRYNNDNNYRY